MQKVSRDYEFQLEEIRKKNIEIELKYISEQKNLEKSKS